MKICALCPTFNRPQCLGRLIHSFNLQDYPDRLLLILDDAAQHQNQEGDRWKLVSHCFRYPDLGSKRNVMVKIALECWPDIEAFALFDDDDLYLPWALSASVAALEKADWARPSLVFEHRGEKLVKRETFNRIAPEDRAYQSGWSFRRHVLETLKWPSTSNGEDRGLARAVTERYGPSADTISERHPQPFYIYSYPTRETRNLSRLGPANEGYEALGKQDITPVESLEIGWPVDYRKLPISEGVLPRGW